MKKIINEFFNILKVLLLLIAFGLVFYGLLVTYSRIDKPMVNAIPTLLPFILLLVLFVLNFIYKTKYVNKNLFFNVATSISLLAIIFVGYRAKFESNATLYYKYKINFNPSYFSDNLGTVRTLVYLLVIINALLLAYSMMFKDNNVAEEKDEVTTDHEEKSAVEEVKQESVAVEPPITEIAPAPEPVVEDNLSKTEELAVVTPQENVVSEITIEEDTEVYSIPTENRTFTDLNNTIVKPGETGTITSNNQGIN